MSQNFEKINKTKLLLDSTNSLFLNFFVHHKHTFRIIKESIEFI
jgi:hypothetical protein